MTSKIFNVLLADDDITARYLMQAALEQAGFRVILACDGEEAIHQFAAFPIDMVMLDVEMPGMDGYQTCLQLRQLAGDELPIIMVTGMDDMQSINHAFEIGATDFISKPINWNLIGYHILYMKRAYLNLLALKTANARSKAILSALPDTMFILDNQGNICDVLSHCSHACWLGASAGSSLQQILPANIVQLYLEAIDTARKLCQAELFEYQLKVAQDVTNYFECRIVTIDNNETLCLIRDITERKDAERRITQLAYFDSLTGLPNRQSFQERLKQEIERAKHTQSRLAVLFLDLDGFKSINDALGHNAGDLILEWTADRLRDSTRFSDFVSRNSANESSIELSRLGGDEFTAIIPNLARVEDALLLAQRIHATMRRPFHLDKRDVVLTTSIGIALYPDDGESSEDLLKHADTAMYHAKNEGRDNCQFYSASLTRQAEKRLNLENDLRNALCNQEFHLLYQPQFDIDSERICSVEALVRWLHPQQGLILPLDFIPGAEETGLIIPLGEWILRTACTEAVQWMQAGLTLQVAVNLSPVQFNNPNLVRTVFDILAQTGFPPGQLILEITESALMDHTNNTVTTLNTLRERNIQITLDDFGTGYSSMSYLKRLPINNIKVDQSFVHGLLDDKDSLAIVRAIISLSRNLGFNLTAEGVETLEQAQALKHFGCQALQGYYFGKPVRMEEMFALTEKQWSIGKCQPPGVHSEDN